MASNGNQHSSSHSVPGRRPPRRREVDLSFEQYTGFGEWIYKASVSIIVVFLSLLLFAMALLFWKFEFETPVEYTYIKVEMGTEIIEELDEDDKQDELDNQPVEDIPDFRNQVMDDVRNLQSNAAASESGGQTSSIFEDQEISDLMKQTEPISNQHKGNSHSNMEDTGGIGDTNMAGRGGWGQGSGGGSGTGVGKGDGEGDNNFSGRVTVSYKFEEPVRNARGQLYAPAFRAEHSGTVVITVDIDRNGSVKRAFVSTSSGIKALDDEALRAAKHVRTIFNIDASAPTMHRGTITYQFIAQ